MLKREKENWKNHKFSTGSVAGEDYLKFQSDSKDDLEKMANENGLTLHDFSKNHYCFSAVLTDGEKFVYISQSDVRWSNIDKILIRSMAHEKDYTGGRNQYCNWENVGKEAKNIIDTLY